MQASFFKILTLLIFITLLGCDKLCKDVQCGPEGYCFEGICYCNEEWIGEECELKVADAYKGIYTAIDKCEQDSFFYQVTIQKVDDDQVRVNNLGNNGSQLLLNVNNKECVLEEQEVAGSIIRGGGYYNHEIKRIYLNFERIFEGEIIEVCEVELR